MEGSVDFLLDVLLLGVSYFIHFLGVELEEVGDDFGFWRVGHKAVGGKHGAEVGELCPCFRAVNCTSV